VSASPIEWTEQTWNPFVGCTKISAGCENCYAIRQAARIERMGIAPHYDGVTTKTGLGRENWSGKISLASERILALPERLKSGSMVFVNSMSDFFHPVAEDAMRDRALGAIASRPDVKFQILTKRPEQIAPYLARTAQTMPPNVWLGATVECAATLHRVQTLASIAASVRFLSIEPMLDDVAAGGLDTAQIDWVIAGGESGPSARPMSADWVRALRDACSSSSAPFFFKQWGKYSNNPLVRDEAGRMRPVSVLRNIDPHGKGGALLDGRLIRELPARSGRHVAERG
jgi:protein gp37